MARHRVADSEMKSHAWLEQRGREPQDGIVSWQSKAKGKGCKTCLYVTETGLEVWILLILYTQMPWEFG